MGINIHCKHNSEMRCSMCYSTFKDIRVGIATEHSLLLGKIYSEMMHAQDATERFKWYDMFNYLYKISNPDTCRIMRFLACPDDKVTRIPSITCRTLLQYRHKPILGGATESLADSILNPFWSVNYPQPKGCELRVFASTEPLVLPQ